MKILLATAVFIFAGCTGASNDGGNLSTDTPNPSQSASQRGVVSVKGKGMGNSKPFQLSGSYLVQWEATPKSSFGCFHGANLERADGTYMFEVLASEMLDSKKSATGETSLYNLDDAEYYVNASSGCSWSFTFVPN